MSHGDIPAAVAEYRTLTDRDVSHTTLQKFIEGTRQFNGAKPGSHQPEDLYAAIANVVKARMDRAARKTALVERIRESTISAASAASAC